MYPLGYEKKLKLTRSLFYTLQWVYIFFPIPFFLRIHPVLFSVRLVKTSTLLILPLGGNPYYPNYCNRFICHCKCIKYSLLNPFISKYFNYVRLSKLFQLVGNPLPTRLCGHPVTSHLQVD